MKTRGHVVSPFLAAVISIFAVTAAVIVGCLSCSAQKLTFEASYYFVCYRVEDHAVSAGALSDAVASYGGAGYVLGYGGVYYVTVSCYYSENDATTVCDSLKHRNIDCFTLEVETDDYPLRGSSRKNSELYAGNLNTLHSLSVLLYDCANRLEGGEYDQTAARAVLDDIDKTLSGLKKANADNCFSDGLTSLSLRLADTRSGRIYPKDLRAMQIAVCDIIINVELY